MSSLVCTAPYTEPTPRKLPSCPCRDYLEKPPPCDHMQSLWTFKNSQCEKGDHRSLSTQTQAFPSVSEAASWFCLWALQRWMSTAFFETSHDRVLRQLHWGQGNNQLRHGKASYKEVLGMAWLSNQVPCKGDFKNNQFTLFHCQRNASTPGLLIIVYSILFPGLHLEEERWNRANVS